MLFSRGALLQLGLTASLFLTAFPTVTHAQEDGETLYLTGYLADMLCTRLEIAPDQTNMITNPEEHTVRCELLPACLRSGYGLMQNIGTDGDPLYRVAAVFDEAANDYIVDMFQSMDPATADLRVQIQGTVLEAATSSALTPAIMSTDGNRMWPALNDVPTITVDALQFCNYEGPDAQPIPQDTICKDSSSLLDGLATGDDTLASANLCMDRDISLASEDDDFYLLTPNGCADHATFRDVKRATPASCALAADPCPGGGGDCSATETCAAECTDICGNPLLLPSGATAKSCCLDGCGLPILDNGFPRYDICGNPTLADGSACPAGSVGENQVNECIDGCGSILTDNQGNFVNSCCLDGCNSPIVDGCGLVSFFDPCGTFFQLKVCWVYRLPCACAI